MYMSLKNNQIIILCMILDLILSVFNIFSYFTLLFSLSYKNIYLLLLLYLLTFKNIYITIVFIISILLTKYILKKIAINKYTLLLISFLESIIYLILIRFNTNIISIILSISGFICYSIFYKKTHNNFFL